jgi:hypothetical protein
VSDGPHPKASRSQVPRADSTLMVANGPGHSAAKLTRSGSLRPSREPSCQARTPATRLFSGAFLHPQTSSSLI